MLGSSVKETPSSGTEVHLCQITLLYERNPHPGRYREVTKTKYVKCRAEVTYQGFHRPLG